MGTATLGFSIGLALAAMAPVAGAATLDGLSMSATYYFPDAGTTYQQAVGTGTFVVGAGVDGTISVENVTDLLFDFAGNKLTLTLQTILTTPTWTSAAFNGPIIQLLSPGKFTGISWLDGSEDMSSRLSFTDDTVSINLGGISYTDGWVAEFDVGYDLPEVPLPATLPLLGAGLGVLALHRRRRQRG